MARVAINGFGRIGRLALRAILERAPDLDPVAVNDLASAETNAHLFKYDSNYGRFNGEIDASDQGLTIDGRHLHALSQRDWTALPWGDLDVDVVIEATGVGTDRASAAKHLAAGAKKVIISAPAKEEDVTLVLGVNDEAYDPAEHHIVSNASCTTNCLAPVVKVLHDAFTIRQGLMNTIHSYTNDQRILDLEQSDMRRARAAALNIIPTTTGAARAVVQVIPDLKGKLDGFALRVPTPTVSVVDFTCEVADDVTVEDVNDAFEAAAQGSLNGILGCSSEELVSMDYKGDSRSSIIDLPSTQVSGKLVKVLSWYDNEWGYACRIADLTARVAQTIPQEAAV
ncbi:MAG: type I glyceraldehyde-3-phosphate dehydrogenase [Chloroflexi bacterium]|nr:type I glyceraldehyde-3-phosphate dehydrogenase [Chloroflexota bacterium]